jgi:hypothetical protein
MSTKTGLRASSTSWDSVATSRALMRTHRYIALRNCFSRQFEALISREFIGSDNGLFKTQQNALRAHCEAIDEDVFIATFPLSLPRKCGRPRRIHRVSRWMNFRMTTSGRNLRSGRVWSHLIKNAKESSKSLLENSRNQICYRDDGRRSQDASDCQSANSKTFRTLSAILIGRPVMRSTFT